MRILSRAVRRRAALVAATVAALACSAAAGAETIPLKAEGGTFVVPVLINQRIVRNFTIDSGSADVSIPGEVFAALIRTGTVAQEDLLDERRYKLADGSEQRSQRFLVRSLRVGGVELRDVVASVAPAGGELLLGQSFLARLKSWSIDNDRHVLVLNESPGAVSAGPARASASAAPRAGAEPPAATLPAGDPQFLKALAYLLTGDESGEIHVVDRAECIVEAWQASPAQAGAAHEVARMTTVHLNNVDRAHSEIRAVSAGPARVEVILRGVDVAQSAAHPQAHGEATHTIVLATGEYQRVRGAWDYIYSHGCRGLNWSSAKPAANAPGR